MEIQQLRKEFNQLLEKINKQSERFTDEDHLPSLEVSVMISKINKLQEVTAVLKYASEHIENRANEKKRNFNSQQNELQNEIPVVTEIIEDETEVEIVEQVVSEIEEPSVEEITMESETEINQDETLQETKNSIGDKFLQTPIPSLKDAFSLNDRYLFANELFNKDMGLFNETIKSIDNCSNLEEATSIMEKTSSELNWDMEDENVLSLQNKVQRRFL